MSELRAGILVTPHNEGMCFHRGSDVIGVTEGETEFYLKSEADKFIEDLEESHKKEVEQLLMEIVELRGAHRWRKYPAEVPPDETVVPVILNNGWRTTDYFEKDKGKWHYHWKNVVYWLSPPKAPEE